MLNSRGTGGNVDVGPQPGRSREAVASLAPPGTKPGCRMLERSGSTAGQPTNERSAMPQTPHVERHFTASAAVRDIVIGMSDGLTVPFALAAGLSGAVASSGTSSPPVWPKWRPARSRWGSGAISAARTDAKHFVSEHTLASKREVEEMPLEEAAEVATRARTYGLGDDQVATVVQSIVRR